MVSIRNIEMLGYDVQIHHYRYFENNGDVSCRGGVTEVEIFRPGSYSGFVGIASCSLKDNYNKYLGVQIALGRAMKVIGIPRKNRKLQ